MPFSWEPKLALFPYVVEVVNVNYTAPVEPVQPVQRITPTSGEWYDSNLEYYYFGTTNGKYLYGLVDKDTSNRVGGADSWDVEYDISTGIFNDVGYSFPDKWNSTGDKSLVSDFPTASAIETHYWYDNNDPANLKISFKNPYVKGMSSDVFCVSQRQDDQLDEALDYVYTKIDLVKSNKASDIRGVSESTVLGLTEKLKTLENVPPPDMSWIFPRFQEINDRLDHLEAA